MTRIRLRTSRRAAFTLIELLVVIAIIAILVSLTSAAVMRILWKIPEMQTRTEISQLDAALGAFMNDYKLNDVPPSKLLLNENIGAYAPNDPSLAFLKKVFGPNLGRTGVVDWNGDGTANGPWILEGEQCLIFYVGGIPNTAAMNGGSPPQCLGFSTNSMNPAAGPGGARKGPYYDFKTSRLIPWTANPSAPNFFVYIDAWNAKPTPKPYAFFSSRGINNGYSLTDCSLIPAAPYRDTGGNFAFSNKYQILSAGANGAFGAGVWNPSGGAMDAAGRDDQGNISGSILGAPQN